MSLDTIKIDIESALSSEVSLRARGDRDIQVFAPFYFPDGDGFSVHIREVGDDRFEITDKADTLQHLGYQMDTDRLREGTRAALFEQIRLRHGVEDRDGELVLPARAAAEVGSAVYSFVHALLQVSDLRLLERENVRSTFADDLRQRITSAFPDVHEDYIDEEHDPERHYPVDFVLNGSVRPIGIFGVQTDSAAKDAVITAEKFGSWGRAMFWIVVQEAHEKISGKTHAWLTDSVDKQFSTLGGNEEAVVAYVERELDVSRRLTMTAGR